MINSKKNWILLQFKHFSFSWIIFVNRNLEPNLRLVCQSFWIQQVFNEEIINGKYKGPSENSDFFSMDIFFHDFFFLQQKIFFRRNCFWNWKTNSRSDDSWYVIWNVLRHFHMYNIKSMKIVENICPKNQNLRQLSSSLFIYLSLNLSLSLRDRDRADFLITILLW